MSFDSTPPVWMEDKQSRNCVLCARNFTMIHRRHHCRQCGVLVCGACSEHRNQKNQRVCNSCYSLRLSVPPTLTDAYESSPPTPRNNGPPTFQSLGPPPGQPPVDYLPVASTAPQSQTSVLSASTATQLGIFQAEKESPSPSASTSSTGSKHGYSQSVSSLPSSSSSMLGEEAVWMSDKQSAECVICYRAFTMMLRRHHCRMCGSLICSKCSNHRMMLPAKGSSGAGKLESQRVCDTCYGPDGNGNGQISGVQPSPDAASIEAGASPPPPVVVDHDTVTTRAVEADGMLSLPSLPSWTYFFSSRDTEVGQLVPTGRLYVRLIRAVNLPAMNRLMATTDPYCVLHCAGQSSKTRIVTNSLNPCFDHEVYFDVLSAREDQLTVIVYDWDQLGKNKEVAYLTIPLADLSHSRRETKWFELGNLSELAKKASNLKDMNHAQAKAEARKRDRALLEEAGESSSSSSSSTSSTDVRVARPRLQLELQYVYNESGLLFSHVLPIDPEMASLAQEQNKSVINQDVFHPPPPFDVDVLYSDLFRLLDLLKPVFTVLGMIGPLLFWTVPWQSFLLLCAFIIACFYPWLILVSLESAILGGLIYGYFTTKYKRELKKLSDVARAKKELEEMQELIQKKDSNVLFRGVHNMKNLLTGDEDDAPKDINARRGNILSRLNPLTTGSDGKALDAKDRSHMNGLVVHMLNGMLRTFGMKGSLSFYQTMLTGWCDLIERLIGFVDWHDQFMTGLITGGVGVVLLYSIFLPQVYLILLVGAYVLTMFTPPSQESLGVLMGVIQYYSVRKSRVQPITTIPPPQPRRQTSQ